MDDILIKSIDESKLIKFTECYQTFNISKIFCNEFTAKYGLDKMIESHTTNKNTNKNSTQLPNNMIMCGNLVVLHKFYLYKINCK